MIGPFIIPDSTLAALTRAPSDRPTLLLLRHSARGPLPPGEPGNNIRLLPEGEALARQLGSHLAGRLVSLHTSPVARCVETAEALADGAGIQASIVEDTHLGDPGVYVLDPDAAWQTWTTLGHERVMAHLVAGERLEGLADPAAASRRLIQHMRARAEGRPGVHVFITHDSLLTAAAAHALRQPIRKEDWPWYLEALALVDEGERLQATYRTWSGAVEWG